MTARFSESVLSVCLASLVESMISLTSTSLTCHAMTRHLTISIPIDDEDEDKEGVWDSIEGSSTGMGGMGLGADLADFAAAALRFRAETQALIGLKGEVKEEVRALTIKCSVV